MLFKDKITSNFDVYDTEKKKKIITPVNCHDNHKHSQSRFGLMNQCIFLMFDQLCANKTPFLQYTYNIRR